MTKLLACDMDGVIFTGSNFWLDLHRAMGTQEEAQKLWRKLGDRRYHLLGKRTAGLWQGRDAGPYFQLIRNRAYVAGAKPLFSVARAQGYRTAIISSGPWHLAERARRELDIDRIMANRLGIDAQGRFDGSVEVQVDNNSKDRHLRRLQRELRAIKATTVVIGDTESDLLLAREAALSIGYNVEDGEVGRRFDISIIGPSLEQAIPYVAAFDETRNSSAVAAAG